MLEVTCTVVSNWEILILCPSLRKNRGQHSISDFINKLSVKIISVFCIKQVLQFKVYQQV